MTLLAELKRRNVIRMAGLYLVGACVVVRVVETVLPVFDVPNSVLRAMMILIALGFVPAIVFARVFELTPEGDRASQTRPDLGSVAQRPRFQALLTKKAGDE